MECSTSRVDPHHVLLHPVVIQIEESVIEEDVWLLQVRSLALLQNVKRNERGKTSDPISSLPALVSEAGGGEELHLLGGDVLEVSDLHRGLSLHLQLFMDFLYFCNLVYRLLALSKVLQDHIAEDIETLLVGRKYSRNKTMMLKNGG